MAGIKKNKVCPICEKADNPSNAFYCNRCGWEFKVLIADKGYLELEQKREEKARSFYLKKENEIKELNARNSELVSQVNLHNDDHEEVKKELESIKFENKELSSQLEKARTEMLSLREELNNMTPRDKMVGIMILTNTLSDLTKYLPIYKGVNTFGTEESNGNHQKINLRLRGSCINPKHFSVEYRNNHLVLCPLEGSIITCDGCDIPASGKNIYPQNIVSVGGILEIRLTLI